VPLGTTLPYGLRDVKIIPYPNLQAVVFGTQLIDLPNAQEMEFNETEDYDDLRGDDHLVTSHGQGAQVEWNLTSGGISFDAYSAISGGVVVDTGITPNQRRRIRKATSDQRPFFTAIGQAISDSGGDMHAVLFLCRATGNLEASFKDGEFTIPGASGIGYPCRVTGLLDGNEVNSAVYDWIQHETATAITAPILDTPSIPTVDSLSDNAGLAAGGEITTIYGTGFTGVTAVNFTATPATDFEVLNSHTITAIVPPHAAGVTNVRVTNAAGQSATGPQNVYTYS
jgi:hypothetical protein